MRKKEVPQETELEQDDSKEQASENSDMPLDDILESWEELQGVLNGETIDEIFDKGWKPLLRTKPTGKQYMVLRLHGKDPKTGRMVDTERGLGRHTSERWDTLKALFEASRPALPDVIPQDNSQQVDFSQPDSTQSTATRNKSSTSSALTTKVARVRPIGASMEIKLGTLQWYHWVQRDCEYRGTLDDFINDTVDSYFRIHHHLELAVVQGGQNS